MSQIGDGLKSQNAGWSFEGGVADHFDEHVSKSVPLYLEGHDLIANLSDFFIKNDSVCYELGSSTGELSIKLAQHNKGKPDAQFIGIDSVEDMVRVAQSKKEKAGVSNVDFVVDDILQHSLQPADLIVSYYTIQFIRPSERQRLFDKVYEALNWGGAFILFEKVRANDARFQDYMTSLYNDFKVAQGYSPEEIFGKYQSLKGVLEPFSTQGNLDFLKRSGFVDYLTVMKYVCFEGFLAIK